jgi:uncharacterized protein (DUF1501 family)
MRKPTMSRTSKPHEETHGRSEVSSSPSGGLTRSGRSGGALQALSAGHGVSRRRMLAALGLGATGLMANLAVPGRFAKAADYKALVCIFLYGGNDGLNTIVPTDAARYAAYAAVRGGLALPQAGLVRLAGSDYGLHSAMSALTTAWNARRLAPVFNVGPLAKPLTKAEYRAAAADSDAIPDSLFSHSDQQLLWESASSSSMTRTGWGGRTADAMNTVNPVISAGGNGHFGLSALQSPLVVPGPGSYFGAHELSDDSWRLEYEPLKQRASALRALYDLPVDGQLGDTYSAMQRDAFEVSQRLGGIIAAEPGGSYADIDAGFAPLIAGGSITSSLGAQLYQIAKLIATNGTVGGSRQLFFAQLGGFDTHAEQINVHAALLGELAAAMACFDAAMVNLGLSDAVTTFTQSDFGRTFAPNNSRGTDHAWGNHHLVIGGAVNGGSTYGRYPTLALGGPDDVGVDDWELQGRWIPTTSVSQYAATLLNWFGADTAQVDAVLPELGAFPQRTIGFV